MHNCNVYINGLKMSIDFLTASSNKDYKIVINADRRPSTEHERCFNTPKCNEVAFLMRDVEHGKRDIVLHHRESFLDEYARPTGPLILSNTHSCFQMERMAAPSRVWKKIPSGSEFETFIHVHRRKIWNTSTECSWWIPQTQCLAEYPLYTLKQVMVQWNGWEKHYEKLPMILQKGEGWFHKFHPIGKQ